MKRTPMNEEMSYTSLIINSIVNNVGSN